MSALYWIFGIVLYCLFVYLVAQFCGTNRAGDKAAQDRAEKRKGKK